jgi:C-terminal processing protease CtpA/Prc
MQKHSPEAFGNIELFSDNYIIAGGGFIQLKKVFPETETNKEAEDQLSLFNRSMYARKAFVEKISDNTVFLRVPSFSISNKKYIDSILIENKELITHTENLIIDLRFNTGGGDKTYENILPFLYTNSIKVIGTSHLSTTLNNEQMKAYSENPDFSKEDRAEMRMYYQKLSEHLNEFVDLNDNIVNYINFDEIYSNPQNVAILINQYCASTTEQFLLAAKQSKKVKLFGTTTAGALDISNLNSVIFPSKKFELSYGTSKTHRLPNMKIDDIGIQPDYYFDKTIGDYNWITKVEDILNR